MIVTPPLIPLIRTKTGNARISGGSYGVRSEKDRAFLE